MKPRKTAFWVDVLVGAAFLAFGTIKGFSSGFSVINAGAVTIGLVFLLLAYRISVGTTDSRGGAGGIASALGDRSNAEGGTGGRGGKGIGGSGGDAVATGKNSTAKGGRGGDA